MRNSWHLDLTRLFSLYQPYLEAREFGSLLLSADSTYLFIMKISGIAKEEKADYLICHDQFTAIGCLKAFVKNKIPFSVFVHEKVTNYSLPILGKIINNLEKKSIY